MTCDDNCCLATCQISRVWTADWCQTARKRMLSVPSFATTWSRAKRISLPGACVGRQPLKYLSLVASASGVAFACKKRQCVCDSHDLFNKQSQLHKYWSKNTTKNTKNTNTKNTKKTSKTIAILALTKVKQLQYVHVRRYMKSDCVAICTGVKSTCTYSDTDPFTNLSSSATPSLRVSTPPYSWRRDSAGRFCRQTAWRRSGDAFWRHTTCTPDTENV